MGPLILVAILVLAPAALAQLPEPPPLGPILGPVVDEAWSQVAPLVENETGQDLRTEEIAMALRLDIRNAEMGILGILFGGGKVETDIAATLNLAFWAVSMERLDAALQAATGNPNTTVKGTLGFNTSRAALTSEEVRVLGGGFLLQAFQRYQEDATRDAIEEALPGMTVLSSRFEWANLAPAERPRQREAPDAREPPILLNATVQVRYLDRFSLLDIVEAAERSRAANDTAEKTLRDQIEENQTLPPIERSAFALLGVGQLLFLETPPGWRLNLTLTVPKGFTIESATDELEVRADRRTATYTVDGQAQPAPLQAAAVATVSNRFLVTSVLCALALGAGIFLRFGAEATVAAARRWLPRPVRSEARHEKAQRDRGPRN